MRRREFITLLSAAAAWPLAATAQQGDRMRRIGCCCPRPRTMRYIRPAWPRSSRACGSCGWTDGRNVRIDTRWAAGDADLIRKYAGELVALGPDVMAFRSAPQSALQQVTRAIPIVFAIVADPVGAGYVESLARPGGNVTGFTSFEYALGGKWLELLKEIAPGTTRVAVLRDPAIAAEKSYPEFGAIQTVAPSLGVELRPVDTAQCRPDRARHHGVRCEFQRWPDSNRKRGGDNFIAS